MKCPRYQQELEPMAHKQYMPSSFRLGSFRPCHLVVILGGLVTALMTACPSYSQGSLKEDGVTITLGIAGGITPDFEGAKDYSISPVPSVSIENLWGFDLDIGGLSYRLITLGDETERWFLTARPFIRLSDSRDEDGGNLFSIGSNEFLDGLGDIDTGALLGGELEVGYGPLVANLSIGTEVADGHGGTLVTLGVGSLRPLTEQFFASMMVSTTWANEDYMQAFFGITPQQASRSIYDPFDTDAGFKDISLDLMLAYSLTQHISLSVGFGYSRLIGDAGSSPIVQGPGGSRDQYSGTLGLTYRFSFWDSRNE